MDWFLYRIAAEHEEASRCRRVFTDPSSLIFCNNRVNIPSNGKAIEVCNGG
jgi:hypothetical protein